mgnify:CR=1 FL=1
MAVDMKAVVNEYRANTIKYCEKSYIDSITAYRTKCHLQALTHPDEERRREYFERFATANYVIGIIEMTTERLLNEVH